MTGSRHRSSRRRRRLRHRPAHRLDIQAQPLGNLLLRHAVHHMHLPDLRPLRQPDHLRALRARVVQHDSVAPLPARARKPVFRVTQGSLFTLPRGVPFHLAGTTPAWMRSPAGASPDSVPDCFRANTHTSRGDPDTRPAARSAAGPPPGPEIHHQRPASILFQPRDLSGCFAFGLPRHHACAGLTLRPTAPSKLLVDCTPRNTFALSSLCHIDTRVGYTTPSRVMYHSRRDQAGTLPCCTPATC